MKKSFLIIAVVISVILMSGCDVFGSNKTMTCTKDSTDEDGFKVTDTMKITYNSDKVLKVNNTNISETDPEYLDMQLAFGSSFAESFNEISGIDVSYTKTDDGKLKMEMNVDFEKIDIDEIKNTLGELYSEDDSFYSKESYTIDEFKNENLEGYSCK